MQAYFFCLEGCLHTQLPRHNRCEMFIARIIAVTLLLHVAVCLGGVYHRKPCVKLSGEGFVQHIVSELPKFEDAPASLE